MVTRELLPLNTACCCLGFFISQYKHPRTRGASFVPQESKHTVVPYEDGTTLTCINGVHHFCVNRDNLGGLSPRGKQEASPAKKRGPAILSASRSPGFLARKHRWQQLGQRFTHLKCTDFNFPRKLLIYWIRHSKPLSITFFTTRLIIFPIYLNYQLLTACLFWLQVKNKTYTKHQCMKNSTSLTPFLHCSKFFELKDIKREQNSSMHSVKESIHN